MRFIATKEYVIGLIRHIANGLKLERLKRPYSMLEPEPFHFPRFSKLDSPWVATPLKVEGLEIDALHDIYGMPRDLPQMIFTVSGIFYGQEFSDFTIEMFGLQLDPAQLRLNEINRLAQRSIGENVIVSNADPDTLPLGGGLLFSMADIATGEIKAALSVWRWRVFLNNSSLCLENNWHTNDTTGGGWIPYILGIVYDNPEKMVADAIRLAPAFRLCNMVDARLGERRGGARNVKVANLPEDIKEALGSRYVELKETFKSLKGDAKTFASASNDWRTLILGKYPVMGQHPDLLKHIDPLYIPENADGFDRILDQWEIAIEIAAREIIPDYEKYSVGGDALKGAAILPHDTGQSSKADLTRE
jgi:hypothetical protein